jgi:pimeloyl-ACP methyl ester carboxylesterase
MSYVDVEGVQTWYADHGIGDSVVLLHGGFSDASEFGGTVPALAERFHVFTPERRGHGHGANVQNGP